MTGHIVVTGRAGFIGAHPADRMLADGQTVVGIDSPEDYYPRPNREANLQGACARPVFTSYESGIFDLARTLAAGGASDLKDTCADVSRARELIGYWLTTKLPGGSAQEHAGGGGEKERGPMTSSASDFEIIEKDGAELCYIIRAELAPETTTFVTPRDYKQQVGFIAYPAGGEVQRHLHLPLERHLVGTSEVLFVRKGRCVLDVYDDAKELVASREVEAGDLVLMVGGGHGLRMLEDTLFLEVKQGPYLECEEKERF